MTQSGRRNSLRRKAWQTLTQGVSQVPHHLRREGQVTDLENGWASVVEGLTKRRPAEYRFTLSNTELDDIFVARYWIGGNRYALLLLPYNGFYFLGIYNGSERQAIKGYGAGIVNDTAGINFPDGDSSNWLVCNNESYLVSTNYKTGFVLESTGSTGLLLNRQAIPAIDSNLVTPPRTPEALLFIQGVNFNTLYELYIDNVLVASYRTPKIDSGDEISTTQVINELLLAFAANAGQLISTYPDGTVYKENEVLGNFGTPRIVLQWEYENAYQQAYTPQAYSDYPPGSFVYGPVPGESTTPENQIIQAGPNTISVTVDTDNQDLPLGKYNPNVTGQSAKLEGEFSVNYVDAFGNPVNTHRYIRVPNNTYMDWKGGPQAWEIELPSVGDGYWIGETNIVSESIGWTVRFYPNGYLTIQENITGTSGNSTVNYQFGPATTSEPIPSEGDLDLGLGSESFIIDQNQYVAWLRRNDGGDFTIRLEDSNANTLGRAIKNQVSTLNELPTLAPNGFPIRVANDPTVDIDDYWVIFETSDDAVFSDGQWKEGPAPAVSYRIVATTMPQVLREVTEGEFFYGPADGAKVTHDFGSGERSYDFPKWGDRTAGDEESAPDPVFIGQPISDLKIFRQRLVMTTLNQVMFSETDDIFNFFPDTVTNVLDTAPFDLLATGNTNSYLQWMVVTGKEIMAFAEESQFVIEPTGDSAIFSPRTAGIFRLSTIETVGDVRPQLAGPTILLPTKEYGFTHVREYQYFQSAYTRIGLNLGNAQNVTEYVPKYIPGTLSYWAVSDNLDYGLVLAPDDPRSLYVYQYRWTIGTSGTQKLQSAWSKWTFSQKIINFQFEENALQLYMGDPKTGVEVCTIDSSELQDPTSIDYLLDRKLTSDHSGVTSSYDPETNWTTFTLPIVAVAPIVAITQRNAVALWLGETSSGNQIVCEEPGDWTEATVVFGERYEFKCEMSRPYLTSDGPNNSRLGELANRLQINYWTVRHFNSAFYNVEVKRKNRQSTYATYRSRTLGVEGNRLGTEVELLQDGELRVPVHTRNTESELIVKSDSWLPVTLVGAEWEGMYSNRARRTR